MKVDLKLLKSLYLIDHPSTEENEMISFIINFCYKIPNIKIYLDFYRNLFIEKNTNNPETYPCVVAHMDTVHTFDKQRELYVENGIIRARYKQSKEKCGLNADDCNGILVALQLLKVLPDLKVCFTVEEEIGGFGAEQASKNTKFFSDVIFLIQADRRGSSDLITYTNGIKSGSKKFVKDISKIMEKHYYVESSGIFTDIGILAERLLISGVNVSCGYYHEHTHEECCNLVELENCLNFIYNVIVSLRYKKQPYTIEVNKIYNLYKNYHNDFVKNEYFDYLPCNSCSSMDCMNCDKYNNF